MILVTAATGTVGAEVVKQLSEAEVPCKAMVHDPSKADFIRFPGVDIVQGEFAQPEILSRALSGGERVFLASPPNPEQADMEGNMIRACQQAGVSCIVKLSVLGASPDSDVPSCLWNGQIEQRLQQSGLAYTILQPNAFMQNLLQFAGPLRAHGALWAPMGDARISFIDAREVAAVAVASLTQQACRNQTYVLTGPQALGLSDCARTLSSALDRPVRYEAVSPDLARRRMRDLGMPDWKIDLNLKGAEAYLHGEGSQVTTDVQTLLGRPATTFQQFARDYAPVFLGTAPDADIEIMKAA